MIPAPFEYKKARTIDEAIGWLNEYGYDAKLLAGGYSLIPAMKLRLNRPGLLIDISALPGMNSIREEGEALTIGANCTHADIMRSDLVGKLFPALAKAASVIGDVQVRNRGTIGGSLAHADPASDYPAVVLAGEASVEVRGINGSRSIDAEEFFQGIYTTALSDNEIITAVKFRKSPNSIYLKFHQSASRFAVVGCAAVMKGNEIRIGITGVSDTPYRARGVESNYDGSDNAAKYAVEGVDVLGDHFASEEYRSHLARVFVSRAINALQEL